MDRRNDLWVCNRLLGKSEGVECDTGELDCRPMSCIAVRE